MPFLYLVLKNLVLPRNAGSSIGHACPALRESEFFDSALDFLCLKMQIPSTKLQINPPAIARHERAGLKFQYSTT